MQPGGNASKAGLKSGDTVLYTSSFFGDELWPADKLAFTKTAINAKQNDVDFIVLRGKAGDEINVKRLKARPSPPRFGRKLSAQQKARATHICLDCGCVLRTPVDACSSRLPIRRYIYFLPTEFDEQPKDYEWCALPAWLRPDEHSRRPPQPPVCRAQVSLRQVRR